MKQDPMKGRQAGPANPVDFNKNQFGAAAKVTGGGSSNKPLNPVMFNKAGVGNHANITQGHSKAHPVSPAPLKGKVMGK